ncbi:RidA family protein [Embleya sp. NPDC050154]|uniref:RidA family protein n=1 Tax=Embleya sp. NPDC050154 TaxID=3363988 RepID=UPI0037AB23F2
MARNASETNLPGWRAVSALFGRYRGRARVVSGYGGTLAVPGTACATVSAGVGGSFDDVAKPTVYVVDWTPDKMPLLGEGVIRAAARLGVDPVKPITLLGVAALGEPDLLVEVEATAVLD